MAFDPDLDLVLRRDLPVATPDVWRAWTQPDLLMQWFTPRPWRTTDAEIGLYPGGIFRTVMQGPDGEEGGGTGCILEVVPERRLVWTGGLLPDFRPVLLEPGVPVFTAVIEMEPVDSGTRYTATVRHADADMCRQHEQMGFQAGWGAALDQLVELLQG